MRAAIYARYSTEHQREASIDDQVRSCQARAERDGLEVVEIYTDQAISGATSHRPGWQKMIAAAREGRFDVVVTEGLDRLSRDQEHIAGFYKTLTFAGVRIVTVSEGEISELHIGLKGTMNAIFLKDLAIKTHRGLEGRIRAGRSGGGICFGYRVARRLDPAGAPVTGEREIDLAEAQLIRRIFTDYLDGRSPRAIALELNKLGVPGPRQGKWTASLILGNASRETGILRNRLYAGELVWNRQHFIKDPATGKRVARVNPRAAWVVELVPALRIVPPDIWAAVQARMAERRNAVVPVRQSTSASDHQSTSLGSRLGSQRRPSWLLAGLVTCGSCGGPLTVVCAHGRLGCANQRERGTCSNRRTILRDRVVARVLVGLKTRLLTPDLVEAFATAFVEEAQAAIVERTCERTALRAEKSRIDRQIDNLLSLMKDGGGSRTMAQELRLLERRQEEIEIKLTAPITLDPVPARHPNLAHLYRQKVDTLEEALSDPRAAAAASVALRSLIDRILVHPLPGRGQTRLELRGELAAFLYLTEDMKNAGAAYSGGAGDAGVCSSSVMPTLVAGVGFEPTTFRL